MKRSTFLRGALAAIFALAIAMVSPAWAQAPFDPPGLDNAIAAKDFHVDRLLGIDGIDGVVGVGVGLTAGGQAAVVIMTEDLWVTGLPRSLDGVPVLVKVTGAFHAVPKPDCTVDPTHPSCDGEEEPPPADPSADPCESDPTAGCHRPVPIGVSTGNEASCSAGTIGARVKDVPPGTNVYALSNNHVYALSNGANIGDGINQPGVFDRYDGAICEPGADDQIGALINYKTIVFDGDTDNPTNNTIDAAIALSNTLDLGNATPSDGYGTPNSTTAAPTACLNKRVQKYGRTTSLTKGSVFTISATVLVGYSGNQVAQFVDQIVVDGGSGGFIMPGDSGSLLILQRGKKPCGLLFAGSSTGKFGIANPINAVLSYFGVTIDGS